MGGKYILKGMNNIRVQTKFALDNDGDNREGDIIIFQKENVVQHALLITCKFLATI